MKRTIVILLAVFMMLSFTACANNSEAPKGMKDVARDENPFNFYVPQSWMPYSGDVVGAYYSVADKSNITIMPYGGDYSSSEEYWADFKTRCSKEFEEFEVVSENEAKIVAKTNALQYVYKMKVDGVKYQCKQYVLAYGGILYVITYTSTEEKFDSHADNIETIIAEFKFK